MNSSDTIQIKMVATCLAVALLFGISDADAAAGSDNVDVTIKGIILSPPPCTINNNQIIDVNFGDAVDIGRVDGKNYLKDIAYSLDCQGAGSKGLSLSIQGIAADFDDGAALDAGHGGLGIELQSAGEKLPLGKAVNFTWPDVPALQAVPVKKAGTTLDTGAFNAGATMVVDWQ